MRGLLYKNFRINFSSCLLILITAFVCCASIIAVSIVSGADFIAENDGALMFAVLYYFVFMMPSLTSNLLFEADENKTASAFAKDPVTVVAKAIALKGMTVYRERRTGSPAPW